MFQGLAVFSYGTIQTLPFVDIEVVHLFLVFLYQYSCTELPSAKHLFQEKLYDSLYVKHSLFSSQLLHIFNFLQNSNSKTIFFSISTVSLKWLKSSTILCGFYCWQFCNILYLTIFQCDKKCCIWTIQIFIMINASYIKEL